MNPSAPVSRFRVFVFKSVLFWHVKIKVNTGITNQTNFFIFYKENLITEENMFHKLLLCIIIYWENCLIGSLLCFATFLHLGMNCFNAFPTSPIFIVFLSNFFESMLSSLRCSQKILSQAFSATQVLILFQS